MHFNILWCCERVQASCGVDRGVLDGSVPVRLAIAVSDNRTQYVQIPYSRNAEKAYIDTMKCQQDSSRIVVSLASFKC